MSEFQNLNDWDAELLKSICFASKSKQQKIKPLPRYPPNGITSKSIDLSAKQIRFESLKKRKRGVWRAVPVPLELLDTLDMVHDIREIQKKGRSRINDRLWTWTRMTAWRKMTALIKAAGIEDGPHASPKGLRHGFGVTAVSKGIALNMVQKWLGHAKMETTSIYANAVGEEEQNIAARMWS